jgi:hypothetical protein
MTYKTGNGTCAETNNGPLSFKSEIHNHPSQSTSTSSEVGVEDG